jgi:predicted metal-dependent hydrolase
MAALASTTIEDSELGKIKITKYKGAKSLKIKVREDLQVSVSLPYRLSFKQGIEFLHEKKLWIQEQISKFKNKKPERSVLLNGSLEEFLDLISKSYRSKFRELELICVPEIKPCHRLSPSKIKLYYPPATEPIESWKRAMADCTRTAWHKALRVEARAYLPRRLAELAKNKNLKYKNCVIKKAKTRWGSCSADNNINLSMFLMSLPDDLIDYVILHELAHTRHKNHSKEFWWFLSELSGGINAKTIDKRLKKYRPDLVLV